VTYLASLVERKGLNAVQAAAIRRASVQTMKIRMRYARINSVQCLNTQYMAKNLSPKMKAAVFAEANVKEESTTM